MKNLIQASVITTLVGALFSGCGGTQAGSSTSVASDSEIASAVAVGGSAREEMSR